MAQFCVFTPTYNRAYTLGRLFESLQRQTFTDFEWLVVDDGSTDDTQGVVAAFAKRAGFPVVYRRVANGGKQRAMNIGAEMCADELFLCVDSDDWLTDDALEVFASRWERWRDDPTIAGMVCPRMIVEPAGADAAGAGQTHYPKMPEGVERCSAWDLYETHGFSGDALHVYRTQIMREHPSPVADGEKFISEGYYIHDIARSYDVALVAEPLQVGEYLPDGYTARPRRLAQENPVGYWRNKRLAAQMSRRLSSKVENTILYLVGCMMARKHDAIADAPYPALAVLCWMPALVARHTVFR